MVRQSPSRSSVPVTALLTAAFLVPVTLQGMGLAHLPPPSPLPVAADTALVDPDGQVDWSVYHDTRQTHQIMREFQALRPDLIELEVIGQSLYGQDLLVARVTNQATGPHDEKPAVYVDGAIHAREFTSNQVALYWLAHLVNNHGEDPQVTRLVDTRTFYIHPKFNPDGADLALYEDAWLRSTPRPIDLNGDGIPDSDPPEDLTGNGKILQMRFQDPEGRFVLDPDDSRILRPRREGDPGPFYSVMTEGVDRNGDGIINSDGLGGIDMNRNWPRNWERWHLQGGSGDYPLSEPETRAVADFFHRNRNISLALFGHTSGAFIYRLPSAMDPREFDSNDEALVVHLGEWYTRDTGRPVRPSAVHPENRRYGTLMQWAYSDLGIIGFVPEFSPPPDQWVPDYDDKGFVDEADWHRYNDEEFGGRYFEDWVPFDHPQLGPVEIGGWHRVYWGQNPPHALLEQELALQIPWYLYMAEQTPHLAMDSPVVRALAVDGGDQVEIEVTVRNDGFLPTNITERGLVGQEATRGDMPIPVVRLPVVELQVEGGRIVDGAPRRRIGHLAGSSPNSAGVQDREAVIRFVVEVDEPGAEVRVVVHGGAGGVVRSDAVPLRVP
ncbi:MAG: hypothetical protein EA422_15065 [Gemmatimonadales bacterium]|nr:MAG: hypothetical protein EA422_15065 [Gemmatimonadales bacterium]